MDPLDVEDLVRERRDRLAMAQGKIEDRAQRLELDPPRESARIVRPQSEELALSAFPDLQPTVLPDEDAPAARKKLFGQSIATAMAEMADGTAAAKHGNPLLNIGTGIFKAFEVSGNIASSIARPVIFGAQNFVIPGQQDLQRKTNQLRESGLSWGQALNRAYEETNLEGPTIPFFTTAFTPNGSITIDFEDVIEAGFDPIDLALTLSTGGIGKGLSVAGKQGLKAGLRTAAVESTGARLGRAAGRTTSNLVDDPLSLVSPRLRVGLLNDVAPLRAKPVINARLIEVDIAADVTFRKKTPARAIELLTKNVPLARWIMGTRPAHFIAEKIDPSQTAGDSIPHRASVLYQQYAAQSANAVDAAVAYINPDNMRKAFNVSPRDGRVQATNIRYTPAGAKLSRPAGPKGVPPAARRTQRTVFDETLAPRRIREIANSSEVGVNRTQPLEGITPRVYRETSPSSAYDIIANADQGVLSEIYTASHPDLALGQHGNRGVLIEFSTDGLTGKLNFSAPGLKHVAATAGQAEILVRHRSMGSLGKNVVSVTIDPARINSPELRRELRILMRQLEEPADGIGGGNLAGRFTSETLPDGRIRLTPRAAGAGPEDVPPAAGPRAAAASTGRLAAEEADGTVRPLLGDLMEGALFDADGRSTRNSLYTGLTPDQMRVLGDLRDAVDDLIQMGVDNGVLELSPGAIPGRLWKFAKEVETGAPIDDIFYYASRLVREKTYIDPDGVAQKLVMNRAHGLRGGNTGFLNARIHEFMEEGAQAGISRYADWDESFRGLAGGMYRLISEKRVKDYLTNAGQLVTADSVLRRLHPGIVGAAEMGKKFEKATVANVNRLKRKSAARTAKRTPMKDELARADSAVAAAVADHKRLSEKFTQLFIKHEQQLAKAKAATNDGLRRKHRATAQRTKGRMEEMASEVGRASNAFRVAIEEVNVGTRARTRLAKLEDELMGVTDDLLTAEAEVHLARLTSHRATQVMNEKIAQISESHTLDARVFGLTKALDREIPVGRFTNPALQGQIAPRDTVDVLNKLFNDRGSDALRKVEAFTGTARTLSTGTADVGWLGIQGSLLAFTHPVIYAKAAATSLRAIFSPQLRDEYIRKNMAEVIDFIQSGGDIGSSEFFQSIDRGGMLSFVSEWALRKTDKGTLMGEIVERWGRDARPIGRLGTGFNTFLDVSKIEMWKSMRNMPLNGHVAKRELATHINNMMGTMNTQLLGLSPTQRQIEGALLFFSPRYTRSAFALVGDLLQSPGKIGTMDGLAQRHAMRAISGFIAGGTTVMWGLGQATGQDVELNPMKPGWLTVNIGGQTLGIGGSTRALLDVMAKATASVAGIDDRNITDVGRFNVFDPDDRRANPLLQYWLNRTAPGVREVLTRETFDGEKLDSPGEFALRGLAPKFLPFAIDAQLNPPQQVPHQSPFALVPEVLGLRSRPLSAFERRNKKRDEVAQATFSKDWEDLGMDEKAVARRDNEELNGLEELARNVEDPVFAPYFDRLNRDRQIKDNAIANAAAEFRANPAGGRTFREKYDLAIAQERVLRESREDPHGEHATALKKLRDSKDEKIDSQAVFDRQFDDYIADVRDNPEHRDKFGNVDFRAIDVAEKAFREQVGEEAFQRIRNHYRGFDNQGNQLRDIPQEVIDLRQAREILRENEYWKIPERYIGDSELIRQVWDEYQSLDSPAAREGLARRFPEIKRIATRVGRDRKRLRLRNADVDRALVMFYGLRAVNPEVRVQERELLRASRAEGRQSTEGSFQIS